LAISTDLTSRSFRDWFKEIYTFLALDWQNKVILLHVSSTKQATSWIMKFHANWPIRYCPGIVLQITTNLTNTLLTHLKGTASFQHTLTSLWHDFDEVKSSKRSQEESGLLACQSWTQINHKGSKELFIIQRCWRVERYGQNVTNLSLGSIPSDEQCYSKSPNKDLKAKLYTPIHDHFF